MPAGHYLSFVSLSILLSLCIESKFLICVGAGSLHVHTSQAHWAMNIKMLRPLHPGLVDVIIS
jgi:hypothetical protein